MRKDRSAESFAAVRRIVLNTPKNMPGKIPAAGIMCHGAYDDDDPAGVRRSIHPEAVQ